MRNRSAFGWVQLLIGILMIVLGILAFASPDVTLTGLIVLYGVMAVLIGVCDIAFYVKAERFAGFGPVVAMISGILSVMAGIMLLVYPNAGKLVLSLLFPIWFISHCISQLVHLNLIRVTAGNLCYVVSLVTGIVGLVLGVLMLFLPALSLFTASFMIGIYLVVLGMDSILLACSSFGARR